MDTITPEPGPGPRKRGRPRKPAPAVAAPRRPRGRPSTTRPGEPYQRPGRVVYLTPPTAARLEPLRARLERHQGAPVSPDRAVAWLLAYHAREVADLPVFQAE